MFRHPVRPESPSATRNLCEAVWISRGMDWRVFKERFEERLGRSVASRELRQLVVGPGARPAGGLCANRRNQRRFDRGTALAPLPPYIGQNVRDLLIAEACAKRRHQAGRAFFPTEQDSDRYRRRAKGKFGTDQRRGDLLESPAVRL